MRYIIIPFCALGLVAQAQVTNGLVAHWAFGGDFNDGSGNGHHASPVGTVGFTADRNGANGCAALFSGDHLHVQDGPDFTIPVNGDLTISLWYAGGSASVSDLEMLLEKKDSLVPDVGTDYHLALYDGNKPSFGSQYSPVAMPLNFSPNAQWHHLVAVYSDHDWYVYYDNVQIAMELSSQYGIFMGSGDVQMGRGYQGALDDVRFYDRALSALEIDSLFNETNSCTIAAVVEEEPLNALIGPNPTSDRVEIQLLQGMHGGTCLVMDALGRTVVSERFTGTRATIDLSALRKGAYTIKIVSGDRQRVVRLMKQD